MNGADTKNQLDRIIEYSNAPTYPITVESEKGTGVIKNPAGGEAQKKVSDVFTLAFETSADYEFIKWKIIDKKTKTESPNGQYLSIQTLTEDTTTCTFVQEPPADISLVLYAVTAKRPKVISNTPLWSDDGAYRDARIQLMFDHDMDENSIYFDPQTEIPELKAEYNLIDSDFLANDEGKIYCYKKNGVKYYKNISVENYNSQKSLLNSYGEPCFEDPRTLVIPANNDNTVPASGTQILVTIGKDICYRTSENKAVALKEDCT